MSPLISKANWKQTSFVHRLQAAVAQLPLCFFPHNGNAVPLKQVLSWNMPKYTLRKAFKILIFCFFVPKCKHWRGRRNERAFTSLSLAFYYSEPAVISGTQTVGGIVSEYCDNTTQTMHPVQLV